jgi:HSP20 family protein
MRWRHFKSKRKEDGMARQNVTTSDQSPQQPMSRASEKGDVQRARYAGRMYTSPMDFLRFGPFGVIRRMNEEMARMLGQMAPGGREAAAFVPPIEVLEREGKYVVRVELPGVKVDNVRVATTDEAVLIEGERQCDESQGTTHVTECRYGRFYRAIPLPEGVNADQVTARFDNGVLEIEMPVTKREKQPRQIPIQSSQGVRPEGTGTSGKAA